MARSTLRRSRLSRLVSHCCLHACAALCFAATAAVAQTATGPGAQPIDPYIHASWSKLERSMVDCKSLVDPKTRTAPILYLPFGMAEPASAAALKAACNVSVMHLPRRIDGPGTLLPAEIPTPGLLYLPNPYVVPGGRFNEMYGWDSYFILLGLVQDERLDLARGMVENFIFEIENYGSVLNANRTYYLTRAQPPLFSSMIRLVYDADINATPQGYRKADAWLATAYKAAVRDHAMWLSPQHQAGDTGLARYYDFGEGPVPEMADDSTYYPDTIHWLLAHPDVHTGYLVDGPENTATPEAAKQVTAISCDPSLSEVCQHAHVGNHWLTRAYYKGDRADRESGFDATFRFGPFAGSTQQFAPVGLNALLYKYENDLAWMAAHLHQDADAAKWRAEAAARKAAMDKYLWNAKAGTYYDWNFVTHTQSTYPYVTMFYPLWAGAASAQQQQAVDAHLHELLHQGGIAESNFESGLQWDLPYGWAPTTYFAVAGLERSGDDRDARDVAQRFMQTVRNGFAHDGTLREKYNVVQADSKVQVMNGYRENAIGFGWTNGVYLRFQQLLAGNRDDAQAALGMNR